jgi:hypothetical protein
MRLDKTPKVYLNDGTHDQPSFRQIRDAFDVVLKIDKDYGGRQDIRVSFWMPWDETDAHFLAMRHAFWHCRHMEFMILDAPIDNVNAQGLKATMFITMFNRNSDKAQSPMDRAEVTLLACPSDHVTEWTGKTDAASVPKETAKVETWHDRKSLLGG